MLAPTYRVAQAKDQPALDALTLEAGLHHHGLAPQIFSKPVPETPMPGGPSTEPRNDALVFVAEEGDLVIGFVFAEAVKEERKRYQPTFYVRLNVAAVSQAHRGRGIGRHLVSEVERWARGLGCTEVRLNVWAANVRALELYRELGYEPMLVGMSKQMSK
jgi:GNAT superfamily N-acetyltransferase